VRGLNDYEERATMPINPGEISQEGGIEYGDIMS
jgi:hypothetical protein